MAARTLYRINLTDQEQSELERLEQGQTTEQHIAKRARIIRVVPLYNFMIYKDIIRFDRPD